MKIDKLLILDSETTGLSPQQDSIIEIAVCLYDIEHASPIASFASLIIGSSNGAEHVNQIPVSLLQNGLNDPAVWQPVFTLADEADIIVAHRAEFDFGFVPASLQKLRPWACSKFDMDWPKGAKERGDQLVHLALAHNVPVYSAHRAMADVDTLVRTLQAADKIIGPMQVREMIEKSLRPKAVFQALVSFEKKDKAKEAGFKWNADKKQWTKRMFLDEVDGLPFKTKQVG